MESKTDIAIYLSSFAGGGAERVLLSLAQWFYQRGLTVDIVLVSDHGPLNTIIDEDVRLVKLNKSKPSKSLVVFRNYLKTNRPRAILSGITHANISCAISYLTSHYSGKLLLSEHIDLITDISNRPSKLDAWLTTKLIKFLYPHAHNIIAVSKGVADSVHKISGLPIEKIRLIYNPIDEKKVSFLSNHPAIFPWQDHFPILISAGRLETQKDFPCLLKAFSILRKRYPAHLAILGEGSQRKNLEHIADSLHLSNDVWFPGFIKNPYPYLAQSKLFVLSSHYEGLGNVLVEALALDIPIVSTNCPSGPEEILEHGKYGRLVPVGDPFSMAEAMEKSLSGDHPFFDRKEALQRFQPELIVDQYLEALGFSNLKGKSSPAFGA